MSLRFQRNLSCFYCGSRSTVQWKGGPQSFECRHCEATNYIDKKGQPTEPPPQSTPPASSTLRFAKNRSPPRFPLDSALPTTSSSIFCHTCQRNQLIVRECLASYLPDDNDPRYRTQLASLPTHEKELHQRYPQCCALCAPAARKQLEQSTRLAKSDYLRRGMDRSRTMVHRWHGTWTWTGLVLRLARAAWWASLLVSILWHALVVNLAQEMDANVVFEEDEILSRRPTEAVTICAPKIWTGKRLPSACAPDLSSWMPLALMLSVLTIWWHPLMLRSRQRPGGRYTGRPTFYFLQMLALALRWFAFTRCRLDIHTGPYVTTETLRGIHGFVGVALVLLTFLSYKSIKLVWKPPVSFRLEDKHLLPDIAEPTAAERANSSTPAQSRSSWLPPKRSAPPQFDISSLAPRNSRQPYTAQSPPTPPPEQDFYDPADEMDWSPADRAAYTTLHPQRHPGAQPIQRIAGPSPFHGTLPAAPVAPAALLRNPDTYDQTRFRKATEYQRENPFGQHSQPQTPVQQPIKRSRGQPRKDASRSIGGVLARNNDGYGSDTTDQTGDNFSETYSPEASPAPLGRLGRHSVQPVPKRHLEMGQPRFWPQQDVAETGLEDLLGGRSFAIEDTLSESGETEAGWAKRLWRGVGGG